MYIDKIVDIRFGSFSTDPDPLGGMILLCGWWGVPWPPKDILTVLAPCYPSKPFVADNPMFSVCSFVANKTMLPFDPLKGVDKVVDMTAQFEAFLRLFHIFTIGTRVGVAKSVVKRLCFVVLLMKEALF